MARVYKLVQVRDTDDQELELVGDVMREENPDIWSDRPSRRIIIHHLTSNFLTLHASTVQRIRGNNDRH